MKKLMLALCLVLLLCSCVDGATKIGLDRINLSQDKYVTVGPLSSGKVYDYYTDDVADEITIMTAAQSLGGRGIVYIDAHNYNFAGTLIVPIGVQLIGMVPAIYGTGFLGGDNGYIEDATARFCIINTTHTAVKLTAGSGLENIDFYYPNQVTNSSTPISYPFSITLAKSGSHWPAHVTIKNCHTVNAYDFIDARFGHSHFVVDGLVGTVIHHGILEDNGGHGDIYNNIHFLPHYGGQILGNLLINYICSNMTAFEFGECDNGMISQCGIWNAGSGLILHGTNGLFVTQCIFDYVKRPLVLIDSALNNIIEDNTFVSMQSNYNYAYINTRIYNSSQRAVYISDTASGGNIISSNVIRSGGCGIYNNGPRNIITDNSIQFGFVNSSDGGLSIGINNLAGGSDSIISGNYVVGGNRIATLGITTYSSANIFGNAILSVSNDAFYDNAHDVAKKRITNNIGINPMGALTEPATNPVSGTTYTNYFGCPVLVTISGGTVTQIAINGVNTGLTSGAFVLGPDNSIKVTHSSNPAWTWTGL